MRFPSKNTSFSDSIISKFPLILTTLEQREMTVTDLYKSVSKKTEDIGEFVEILGCLYTLGKLELNLETRCLHYVD